jgi:predicted transcriptional regulator
MDDRIRITIEIDSIDHDALSAIAADNDLSLDDVAADALRARIDLEQDYLDGVRAGLADIEAGRMISDEEYQARSAERRRRWLAARQS